MRRRAATRAGMTLLELVVGLTITAMVTAGGYAALASIVDHRRVALVHADSVAHAAATRRAVVEWITGARLAPDADAPPFTGIDGLHEHLADDQLSFLTTARTPLGEGDIVVRLYVDHDEKTAQQGLVAEFREWRTTRRTLLVLDPTATGLDAEYDGGPLLGGRSLPSWISSSLLPSAVHLRIVRADSTAGEPLLRLPIVVPTGGG